jgi:hypothetical protein
MLLRNKFLAMAVFITAVVVLFYALGIRGWDSSLSKEYSPTIRPSETASDISEITMQRYGCLGPCPIYTVSFKSNGTASYVGLPNHAGTQNWHKIGTYLGETKEFPNLATWIESQHFFELREKCDQGATDTEVITTTVIIRETVKKVVVCDSSKAPPELRAVYSAIDQVASRVKWHKPS